MPSLSLSKQSTLIEHAANFVRESAERYLSIQRWPLIDGEAGLPLVAPDFSLYSPCCEVAAAELIPSNSSWAFQSFRYDWERVRQRYFRLGRKGMAYNLRPRSDPYCPEYEFTRIRKSGKTILTCTTVITLFRSGFTEPAGKTKVWLTSVTMLSLFVELKKLRWEMAAGNSWDLLSKRRPKENII